MHDKISARFYSVAAHRQRPARSYQHYVMPRMRNTYMLAGRATPDEVVKSVIKGIYIEDVSNGEVTIGQV